MTDSYNKTWRPVTLSGMSSRRSPGGGSGIQSVTGHNWYSKLFSVASDRMEEIRRYDQMDEVSVDVSRALDIMAEDISSDGAEDDIMFEVDFPEYTNITRTTARTIEKTLRKWTEETGLDYMFYEYARELVKYGSVFFRKNYNDELLYKIDPECVTGFEVNPNNAYEITHYTIDECNSRILVDHHLTTNKKAENVPIDDLFILKIGKGPFGESVLKRVYRIWKQLQLLEDAVVIYRISRAPERRVFYIDVGRLSGTRAESYMEATRARLQQQNTTRNGEIDVEYNPASIQKDYYIAQSGDGKGSRVDTLPGGSNLGEIQDIGYFARKLAMGLRVPPSYLEHAMTDSGQGAMNNDGRVGTAYMTELRYVGYISRIQKIISKPLKDHFEVFSRAIDVEIPEDLIFRISPPQSFAEHRRNELNSILINTVSSSEHIAGISKKYALERFLMLDKVELEENEYRKLMENGYSKKEINDMSEEVRMNIVYGDGRKAPDREHKTDEYGY